MPIKVSIVEHSPSMREGLRELIGRSSSLICVGNHCNAGEAAEHIFREAPDVVLMDIDLLRTDGMECVAVLKEQLPDVEVLMLTTYEEGDLIFGFLRRGVSGYLLKNLGAIEEVHNGAAPMSMQIARRVVSHFYQIKSPQTKMEKLTSREYEILGLLAKGYLYEEIAGQLTISISTVREHLHLVYEKLHAQSRAEAVVK